MSSRRSSAIVSAAVLALAAGSSFAQQYRLQHTNSINLAPSFFGPGPMGEPSSGYGSNPLNVAFDGTNAYVGGFNNSGVTDSVGIVKVMNVLTAAPTLNNLAASQIASANVSRGINGLAYSPTDGALIYAYDSGGASTSVISSRNSTTGAENWSQVNPQGARPFTVGIDPLGDSGAPGVAFMVQGSGRRRLISLASGTTIFDGTNGGIVNANPAPPSLTTWRGIAFDPEGNVALSTSTAAAYGLRVTNNQWSDLGLTAPPTPPTNNVTARAILKTPDVNLVGTGIAILNNQLGGATDLIAFNARTTNSGDLDFDVNVTPLEGAGAGVIDARNVHIRNRNGSTDGLVQTALTGGEDGVGTSWTGEAKELAFGTDANGLPVLLAVNFSERRLDVYSLEPTWNLAGGGNWSSTSSWLLGAVPDSSLANARFGSAITSPSVVTVDGDRTAKVLRFDNANSYTLSSGINSIVTLDSPGTPLIEVLQGNHTIDVGLQLNKDTNVAVAGGNTLTVKRFRGAGVNIGDSSVRVRPDGGSDGRSTVTSLTLGASGKLDITNNAVVVDYTPVAEVEPFDTIKAQITSAYNGGAWNGNGITSSNANANNFAVGYAEASALQSIPAIFGTVDADAVLIRYTRYGDADLSGFVNSDDFNRLASAFGTSGNVWSQGNFNFDAAGEVNSDDFNLLATNFGLAATGPNGEVTPQDWANLAAAVPEPSTGLLLLTGLAISVASARRRRG